MSFNVLQIDIREQFQELIVRLIVRNGFLLVNLKSPDNALQHDKEMPHFPFLQFRLGCQCEIKITDD